MLYYVLERDVGDDYNSAFSPVKEILSTDTLVYSAQDGVDATIGKSY